MAALGQGDAREAKRFVVVEVVTATHGGFERVRGKALAQKRAEPVFTSEFRKVAVILPDPRDRISEEGRSVRGVATSENGDRRTRL